MRYCVYFKEMFEHFGWKTQWFFKTKKEAIQFAATKFPEYTPIFERKIGGSWYRYDN